MRTPAALVAVPLLAGAAAGIGLVDSAPDHLIVASAWATVICVIAGLAFLADDLWPGVVVCVGLGAACAGYSTGASTSRTLLRPSLLQWFETMEEAEAEPILVEGRLRDDAALVAYGAVLTVDVATITRAPARAVQVAGGVRLVVSGGQPGSHAPEWRAGRAVRAPASLRRPAVFSNPGVPDDRRGLALRGVVLTGTVKSASLVEITAPGTWLSERSASARAWTRQVIGRYVGRHDTRSAAITTAILIGDRTGLSDDDERRLQDAGTYHVIAISGGNIAILTALLVAASRVFFVPPQVAAAVSMAILLFYGEVAGGAASVGRAITAAILFLAAQIIDHRGQPLNVLAVAALLAIGLRPVTALDGGFLLSFGATVAIILGVPRLVQPRAPRPGWIGTVAHAVRSVTMGLAAATVCSEIALAPVSATLFSRVTFAGLALNFAAIPLMTAVQCGSMALLVAAAGDLPPAESLGRLVHASAWALVESSRLVEHMPWAARDVVRPSVWLCVGYYAACVGLLVSRRRASFGTALATAGSLLVAGAVPAPSGVPVRAADLLRVVVLDVGQGDATVAILPDGRALLVDAGGLAGTTFDIGTRVVVPALRALGVRQLHALVLTHGDPDHVGGAEVVMRRLAVANVWEGIPVPPHPTLGALRRLAEARHVVWRTVRPGDVDRAGGVDVRVLHPPPPEWERQKVRNDDSIVIEVRYGRVSILLPGDIGREVEAALIPALDPGRVLVLKAAHHGSMTSSGVELIEAVMPGAVIFSSGRHNRYGHPAQVVVDRFAAREVATFNTAADGAVFVETDGTKVEVRGWKTRTAIVVNAPPTGKP